MFVYVVTRSVCGGQESVVRVFASEVGAVDFASSHYGVGSYDWALRQTWSSKEWTDDYGDVVRITRKELSGPLVNETPVCDNRWRAE